MWRLITLGTGVSKGSQRNYIGQNPPLYMLDFGQNEERLLIECSGNAMNRVFAMGFDPASAKHIFLSTGESYYCDASAFIYILSELQNGSKASVNVYCSPDMRRTIREDWNNHYLHSPFGCYQFNNRNDGFIVRSMVTLNFPFYKNLVKGVDVAGGRLYSMHMRDDTLTPTLGMRLERQGKIFAYTGRTGSQNDPYKLTQGADVWLCSITSDTEEPGHMTPDRAGSIAAMSKVRQLIVTHHYGLAWYEIESRIRAQGYGGRIRFANDGEKTFLD